MLNPLHLIAKDLDNSSEMGDQNTSRQIKQLIHDQKEVHLKFIQATIHETVESLFEKNKNILNEKTMQNPENDKIQKILRSCAGIITNLKLEGKEFDLAENKYLNELALNTG